MNKSSSNNQMEDSFNSLKNIKEVPVPDGLYDKIIAKTAYQAEYQKTVPMKWINIAAAVFFFLMLSEIYLISDSKISSSEENHFEMITLPNNMLYHE